MVKVTGFDHIRLNSADAELARSFFEKLGGHVTRTLRQDQDGGAGYCIQLAPGCNIEIRSTGVAAADSGWKGWDHLALTVGSCEKMCEIIAEAGGTIGKKPSDHMMGDTPIRNAVVRGTDGQKIELIELREEPRPDAGIIGVNHIQLNITDLERTRNFYEKVFDGRVVETLRNNDGSPKGYMVELAAGTVLELAPPRFPCDEKLSPWHSITIEVKDIDEAVDQFVKAGGSQKEKIRDIANARSCVLAGPENETIQLVQSL